MAQGPGLRIRRGTKTHLQAVTRIAEAAAGEGVLPPGWESEKIGERLQAADEVLVALRHGQPIGFLTLEDAGGDVVVSAVAVLASFRGRGVGTALLEAARTQLVGEGRATVAHAPDERVVRFLERSGITPLETETSRR